MERSLPINSPFPELDTAAASSFDRESAKRLNREDECPRERVRGFPLVDELIVNVEFIRTSGGLVARVASEANGRREYRSVSPTALIDMVIDDLREEVESLPPR